jgi:hypothetical protein
MERTIKKIIPISDDERQEITLIRNLIWNYYKSLLRCKEEHLKNNTVPSEQVVSDLSNEFDKIFNTAVTSNALAAALASFRKFKAELLKCLYNPIAPLHNNLAEQAIRDLVIKRKISGGTRSDIGREARDTFSSIIDTCRKNAISFWEFLEDRIKKRFKIPKLADIVFDSC